jgi:WD40 repeat protein/serine/threonine protein kinase
LDQERWLQIEELLQQALDLQPDQRAGFLKHSCDGDTALLAEVEALLKRELEAGSFMESPAIASLPRMPPPSHISHYRIEKRIGAGGMGEVFQARDETLRRVVALKMLPAEFTSDAERVRRFEQEAFAASRLNHPNIITIFEITREGDAHFIVEEIVEGRTLRDLLRDPTSNKPQPLELERALDVAIQIARALKAAHTAWIIHRDIKPENVMVRDDGLVKVLDFGIAKLDAERGSFVSSRDNMSSAVFQTQEASLTVPGAIMGTASYMSPEQARGEPLDGRTDLFSLGIVLYEMVTGVQLFAGATQAVVLQSLKQSDGVVGPALKSGNIPKDLQRILRRALRSDREERYASAGEFLDDLTRLKTRLESTTARRIVLISVLTMVVALTVVGVAAFLSLNETWEEKIFRDGHTAAVRCAVFSPDGRLLVSGGEDNQVIVWDFARRMPLKTLAGHHGPIITVAFSPDGKWFVTGGEDQKAILWDAAELKLEVVWDEQHGPVHAVSFSPDASRVVYSTDTALIVRNTKSWDKERELPGAIGTHGDYVFLENSHLLASSRGEVWDLDSGEKRVTELNDWSGNWLAVAPDKKRGTVIDAHGYLKTFDLFHRNSMHIQPAHQDHGRALDYSPDGKLIASGAERVLLWDSSTMTRIAPLEYESVVWSVAFSPDGRWLVSTHGDGSILIWDVVNRELEANLRQHSGGVRALAFSPDGKHLASASEDQSVILWDAQSGRKESVLTAHQTRVGAVAFSPEGTWLVSSDQSGDVIRHDSNGARQRWVANPLKDLASYCLAISPDGRFIAASFAIYRADTGEVLVFDVNSPWRSVYSAAFTSDGTRLVGANDRGYVVVLDTRTWGLVERQKWSDAPLVTMSLSPDGTQIVTGDDGKTIRLGTISPLRQTAVIGQHSARVKAVAFSPDGEQVASAGDDKMVALWDVSRRKLLATIGTHTSPIYALAFSPDGKRLMTGEHDRSVRQYTRRRSLWGFSLD